MLSYDPTETVEHLRRADPVLARVIETVGPLTLEPRDGAFRMLSRAIFFQQLAGPAARAILGRVLATLGANEETWYEPAAFLAASDEQLRAAGLSGRRWPTSGTWRTSSRPANSVRGSCMSSTTTWLLSVSRPSRELVAGL